MTNRVTRFRLSDICVVLATAMTLAVAARAGLARDTISNDPGSRSDASSSSSPMAIVSNGLVTAKIKKAPLEQINAIFDDMRAGKILGRVVLKLA